MTCYDFSMRKKLVTLVFLLLSLVSCTPPNKQPPPPPPPPPNTAPVLSQPDNVGVVHNTLATPEEKMVSFTATDAEDAETQLIVSATTSDTNLATLTNPSCNELGECTLLITLERTLPASLIITISVKDTKGSEAKKSFNITVAPEERNVANGAELKVLLKSAETETGSSIRLISDQPISLNTQIMLDKELILWGVEQDKTVLDAQNLDRHFWIKPTGKVTMRDLTLTNGNAKDDGSTNQGEPLGGAIFNEGTLTLTNVRIISSRALSGGGLYNFESGQTVITDSIIGQEDARNVATRSGGGVFNNAGRVEINNSQVSFNEGVLRGGGVFNFNGGELLVQSSIVFNNFSEDGTAIKNEEASAIIRDSTLEKNVGLRLEGGAIVNLRGRL